MKENNYRGHGDSVDQLCWHPSNPDLFVTASGDKTIRIWDVRTTKCIATVNTKGESLPSQVSPSKTSAVWDPSAVAQSSGPFLWLFLVGTSLLTPLYLCCNVRADLLWGQEW